MLILQTAKIKSIAGKAFLADLGSYFGINNNIVNKDLTPCPLDRVFDPQKGVTYFTAYEQATTPLALSGSNGLVKYNAGTAPLASHSLQATLTDNYRPYFDSILGVTAGSRYFTSNPCIIYKVKENGELALCKQNSTVVGDLVNVANVLYWIFAESVDYFWVLEVNTGLDYFTNNKISISKVSKLTFATTKVSPGGAEAGGAIISNIKFMGVNTSNKAIFLLTPGSRDTTTPVYGSTWGFNNDYSFYWVVDLTTNTFTYVADVHNTHQAATVNTSVSPSSMTDDLQNLTAKKSYVASAPSINSGAVNIKRLLINKTGSPVMAGKVTTCELVGMPIGVIIPSANSTPLTLSASAEINCLSLVDDTDEYLVVLGHSFLQNGMYGTTYTDGCGGGKHFIFVFKVDPTDSSKLIYCSHNIGGFNTNKPFHGLLKSGDSKTLLLFDTSGCLAGRWNKGSQSFVWGNYISPPGSIKRVSLDQLNQIWLEDATPEYSVFNINDSSLVEVKFQGNINSVNYTGTPINVDVVLNAFDATGNKMVKNVTLILQNAIFTVGGGTTKVFTTSATVDTVVSITINQPGIVNVTPYLG